ncbi:MAG: M20/M25/M40 family metallo-hydrolase [Anaerovoracaceae bacterium]
MTVKEILRDLVAINTIKDKENGKMMDYIEGFLKPYGYCIDRRKNPETGKEVLVADFGKKPVMGFLGHTDTVDITEGWTTDPFTLTEEDGKLYGLGACDMKGGIAASLWAAVNAPLAEIEAAGKGIRLYYTYDEEIMFGGIWDLVHSGETFPPHMIIAEPSDLKPTIGSKGILEYIFTFRGVTTHSSMPIEGKSSNKNAVRFLGRMMDFEETLKKENYPLFGVPHSTMNIGIIDGGTAINKVPAKTTIYLDFRICDSKKEYQKIRDFVDDAIADYDAEYEIINDVPSLYNQGPRVPWYEEMTGQARQAGTGITEASFFESDSIILGPGPDTAHQFNEYITAESLERTAEIYLAAIRKECL